MPKSKAQKQNKNTLGVGQNNSNSLTSRASIAQFRSNPIIKRRIRYALGAVGGTDTFDITSGGLLSLIGMGTVTNSKVTSIIGAVKLNKVEIVSPWSGTTATTCSVEWQSANAPNIEYSDTTMSSAYYAKVSTSPPRNSLAGFWYNQGSTSELLMILNVPASSIVDVWIDFVLYDNDVGAAPTPVTVATATLGQTYYLSLDNATGHLLPPISLNTTF